MEVWQLILLTMVSINTVVNVYRFHMEFKR